MRILHTADWHFGKTLEGRDRLKEQEYFVEELVNICNDEAVDLVLVAGDVFQSPVPSAAAEELFYYAIDKLADNGKRGVVVIAGNHDSPERLKAAAPLAERLGITIIGFPKENIAPSSHFNNSSEITSRVDGGQGWFELKIPGVDHTAVIASLTYPSEGRLRELIATDSNSLSQGYNKRLGEILENISVNYFRSDTVNLIVGHMFITGGSQSDSEYQIQVGGAYAVESGIFPDTAQYVALGHLHRPQNINGKNTPIRYAGSPLCYSFSETGYSKSVTLVDVLPGQKALIKEIHLSSGKKLVKWRAEKGIGQVRAWVEEGRDSSSWIDLEVFLPSPHTMNDIQELKAMHDGFVNIKFTTFDSTNNPNDFKEKLDSLPIDQLFSRFYEKNKGVKPDDKLVKLFLEISQYE